MSPQDSYWEELGQLQEAQTLLEEMLAENPTSVSLMRQLARVYIKRGRTAEAAALMEEASGVQRAGGSDAFFELMDW
jgi:thioredoxin-like negative regulator of GroEL